MQSSAAGFRNAPVSKALLLLTGGMSVLVGVTQTMPHLKLNGLLQIIDHLQLWRLATNQLFFSSPAELLFGLILIYYFRVFERQMGSAKFAGFTFLSFVISTLVEVAYLALFQPKGEFVSGPYSILFAMYVLFFSHVPASSRFRFLGVDLSDKFFVYVLGLQLVWSHPPTSLVAALSGILGGLAYNSPTLPLSNFRFPRFINRFCTTFLLPFLQSSDTLRPRTSARARMRPEEATDTTGWRAGRHPIFGGMPPPGFEPSEEVIQELTSMGFDRSQVIQALRTAQNDPTLATNLLLNQF